MKRIAVKLSGMPFDPTYEIDDDTIAIGDIVRVPGSGSGFIEDGETGTVIALESSYTGPKRSRAAGRAGRETLARSGNRRYRSHGDAAASVLPRCLSPAQARSYGPCPPLGRAPA